MRASDYVTLLKKEAEAAQDRADFANRALLAVNDLAALAKDLLKRWRETAGVKHGDDDKVGDVIGREIERLRSL